MISTDFFLILDGWDTENYQVTRNIRKCEVYIKRSQSLSDQLLVKYSDGTKRYVTGIHLFTDVELIKKKIEKDMNLEFDQIESQLYQLNEKLLSTKLKYQSITIEN